MQVSLSVSRAHNYELLVYSVQVAVTDCVVSVEVSDATKYSIMVLTIASGLLGSL